MISDKALLEFLNDDTLDCSSETCLKKVLDEELEKPENEMDTELIEYCLDALEKLEEHGKDSDKSKKKAYFNNKKGMIHFKRILVIAAALTVIVSAMFSVSSNYSRERPDDPFLEYYGDYIRVRHDKISKKAKKYRLLDSNLAKELETNGITPVTLPEVFLSDDYILSEIECEDYDYFLTAYISLKNDNLKYRGYIHIEQYSEAMFVPHYDYRHVEDMVKITVNGIDVYIFKQMRALTIAYKDGNTIYGIVLSDNVSIEDATEIAKTIK